MTDKEIILEIKKVLEAWEYSYHMIGPGAIMAKLDDKELMEEALNEINKLLVTNGYETEWEDK